MEAVLSYSTAATFTKRGEDKIAGRPAFVYNMSVQASSIISQNIYRNDDKPLYRRGNKILIGICAYNFLLFIGAKIYYRAQTALICLENSHNMAGGTVTPLDVMEGVWAGAREAGLPVHLDGARVFNAAAALGINVAKLTSGFDTVMFCLSKGLGAPVGSMLVGSRKAIAQARIHRKALGGGMRQAGILAAAGLIALHEMPKRLAEDQANARLLAEAVAGQAKVAEIDMGAAPGTIGRS